MYECLWTCICVWRGLRIISYFSVHNCNTCINYSLHNTSQIGLYLGVIAFTNDYFKVFILITASEKFGCRASQNGERIFCFQQQRIFFMSHTHEMVLMRVFRGVFRTLWMFRFWCAFLQKDGQNLLFLVHFLEINYCSFLSQHDMHKISIKSLVFRRRRRQRLRKRPACECERNSRHRVYQLIGSARQIYASIEQCWVTYLTMRHSQWISQRPQSTLLRPNCPLQAG